ncbi:basic proline-rich protein-like [Pogoniulus pusillus]|uniref:basic proline-rich protein-like n=1 Tax=Pogoniulus pusillus TaxID=488313 RepID=UPI0030B99D91
MEGRGFSRPTEPAPPALHDAPGCRRGQEGHFQGRNGPQAAVSRGGPLTQPAPPRSPAPPPPGTGGSNAGGRRRRLPPPREGWRPRPVRPPHLARAAGSRPPAPAEHPAAEEEEVAAAGSIALRKPSLPPLRGEGEGGRQRDGKSSAARLAPPSPDRPPALRRTREGGGGGHLPAAASGAARPPPMPPQASAATELYGDATVPLQQTLPPTDAPSRHGSRFNTLSELTPSLRDGLASSLCWERRQDSELVVGRRESNMSPFPGLKKSPQIGAICLLHFAAENR